MPGDNILGACSKFRESRKAAQTLTISMTFGGTYVITTSTTSQTLTVATATRTLTFLRVPFDGRYYYTTPTELEDETFNLVSKCCCWQCQSVPIFPDFSSSIISTDQTWPYTEVFTDSGGPPPPDTSGEIAASIQFTFSLATAIASKSCCKEPENGKFFPTVILAGGLADNTALLPFRTAGYSFTYEDSEGNSGDGVTTYLGVGADIPPQDIDLPSEQELDFCEEETTFTRSADFSYSDTSGGTTTTISTSIEVSFNLS